jgi:hypothetical protein
MRPFELVHDRHMYTEAKQKKAAVTTPCKQAAPCCCSGRWLHYWLLLYQALIVPRPLAKISNHWPSQWYCSVLQVLPCPHSQSASRQGSRWSLSCRMGLGRPVPRLLPAQRTHVAPQSCSKASVT